MPLFELRLQSRVKGDEIVESSKKQHYQKVRFYQVRLWWDMSPARGKVTPITDAIVAEMAKLLDKVCEEIKIPAEGCGELAKRISVTLDYMAEELGNKRPREAPTVEVILGYVVHAHGQYRGEHVEGCGAVYYPEWP